MQYLWLALLVVSVVLECVISKGIFLSFIPGALAGVILGFFTEPWVQLLVFIVLFFLSFFLLRPFVKRFVGKKKKQPFTVESAVGTRTVVVERLDNLAGRGAVTVAGMEWAARTVSDDIVIEAGTTVEIIAVEGVKFICRAVK